MEENAVLSNVTVILTKDVLVDEGNNLRKPQHFLCLPSPKRSVSYPLPDSEDDDITTFFLYQQKFLRQQPYKKKKRKISTQGCPELNLLNEFTASEFEGYLHMSKMTFLKIFQSLRHLLQSEVSDTLICEPPQAVFSLSLWKLTTDEHFEEIAHKFGTPLMDCHRIIRSFWQIISENCNAFIKWPSSQQAIESAQQGFQRYTHFQEFRELFGVLALQRLDIFLECKDEEVSVVLQIICNADQRVIDCFVDLEQDYSFDSSPIGEMLALNSDKMPSESYLIGDKNFPLRSYLMRPFEVESSEKERSFNVMLKPILSIGQQVLDAMAKRFNTLYALEAKNLFEVRKIVETVCTLHNLCIDIEDDFVERKRDKVQFSWTNMVKSEHILIAKEPHKLGERKRCNLIKEIIG